jgi:hypothetical protein
LLRNTLAAGNVVDLVTLESYDKRAHITVAPPHVVYTICIAQDVLAFLKRLQQQLKL